MKLVLAEPKYLKEPIGIISELVNEVKFKINPDKLEVVAMDPANVAMAVFKLLGSAFLEYDVKETTEIGVNLSEIKAVFRRIRGNDSLIIETEKGKLKLTLKGSSTRRFFLPILDMEGRDQKVPDLQFASTITIPSSELAQAVEDMDIVGESVSLITTDNRFSISSSGDLTKADADFSENAEIKVTGETNSTSKYSIEYLKKMIQGSKLSDQAIIKFGNDYPLRMEFFVLNKLQLFFILAPRVDND